MKALTRWVLRSLLCLIAFSVLHGDVLACEACTFAGVIVKGNGQSGSLTVPAGSTVTLTASAKQPGSTCSRGLYCDWSVNGLPIGSSVGSPAYQYHTFNTPGTYQVSADCECMPCDIRITEYLTVYVTEPPCGANVSLVTETVATIPSDRARTKLGIGEETRLSLTPAPACEVLWTIVGGGGGGALSSTSGNPITFTAPARASTPTTVRSTVNGYVRDMTYNVVEPASVSAIELRELTTASGDFPPGTQGAGMELVLTVHPTDVSLANVQMLEVPGPATNLYGYFENWPGDLSHDPNPAWIRLYPDNQWGDFDTAAFCCDYPPPWRDGGFQWDIPIRFRVVGSVNEGELPNTVLQTFRIHDASGTSTVTKLGQDATRSP